MTRLAAGALVLIGLFTSAPAAQDPPRTTFRSSAAAIAVDVNVRDRNGRPVRDLTAADFQVYDNGVLQQVETLSYGKLPIDVTIALDVSHSVTGRLLDRLRRAVVQLTRDLGKEDRLRLLLFNMRVTRTTDFTSDPRVIEKAIREAAAGGGTALLDAVSVALVSSAAPERRQLIVFFTDGSDSSSVTTMDTIMSVAQRTRGTLTFVMPASSVSTTIFSGGLPTTITRPTRLPPSFARLAPLAGETGGSVLPVLADADLSATFRRVLDQFRSTYVLYYNARGVPREGYHTIEVKLTRANATVQARRGYFGS